MTEKRESKQYQREEKKKVGKRIEASKRKENRKIKSRKKQKDRKEKEEEEFEEIRRRTKLPIQ